MRKLPYPHVRRLKEMRRNLIDRCTNPSNKRWHCYGGKGVVVCEEWMNDLHGFYKWATEAGYTPGLQIDRIDVNGNYEPSNCRFVTPLVNMNNMTINHYLTWNGETQSVSDWARELGVRTRSLQHRVDRKWPLEQIFTQPFRKAPTTRRFGSRRHQVA